MSEVNIIGVSGRIGHGKDAVGDIIRGLRNNSYGQGTWQIKKFAYKLKQIVSILTGIPVEDLEKQEVKDRVLGEEWMTFQLTRREEYRPYTVREVLQRVGTEAMRNQIHQNVWVNALFSEYKPISTGWLYSPDIYPKWVITDVRFPNEAKAIKDRGGIVIRVNRGGDQAAEGLHPSETALDDYEFDEVIINDGTLEDLKEKVRTILIRYEI